MWASRTSSGSRPSPNELTRERLGDIVEIFESRCADVVAGQRGRIIKSLGDSVLFVSAEPVAAYDIAEGIIRVVGRDPRMPEVRVGLASGDVVMRLGDVFGPPVNLASRLTAVARRNRVIIDQTTADLLPEDQFETRRLPARPVRGFGLVEPLTVRRPLTERMKLWAFLPTTADRYLRFPECSPSRTSNSTRPLAGSGGASAR